MYIYPLRQVTGSSPSTRVKATDKVESRIQIPRVRQNETRNSPLKQLSRHLLYQRRGNNNPSLCYLNNLNKKNREVARSFPFQQSIKHFQ